MFSFILHVENSFILLLFLKRLMRTILNCDRHSDIGNTRIENDRLSE